MKQILLLHGFGGNSAVFFFPWLENQLQPYGDIFLPSLPNSKEPNYTDWKSVVKDYGVLDYDLVVAHSLGGTFALNLLNEGLITAKKLVTIGSSHGAKNSDSMNTFLRPALNMKKLKDLSVHYVVAQSFDDPWVVPELGIVLMKQLNAQGYFYADQGHFEGLILPENLLQEIKDGLE